jgi:hypothetical protein
VWGRQCKIHIDPQVASAADNPSVMTKWRDDPDTVIDRFDARAHLDIIPESKDVDDSDKHLDENEKNELRLINYERYRTLVQNETIGISEEQCLKQIEVEEKYGSATSDKKVHEKKEPKAQIGFNYDKNTPVAARQQADDDDEQDDFDDEDVYTFDMALDLDKLTTENKTMLNKYATNYGMIQGDFMKMLMLEKKELDELKEMKQMEANKAQYSGRKSRRERRAYKQQMILSRMARDVSPLSYLKIKLPTDDNDNKESDDEHNRKNKHRHRSTSSSNSSHSRTQSPRQTKSKVLYITSFGTAEDDDKTSSVSLAHVQQTPINPTIKNTKAASIAQSLKKQLLSDDDLSPLRNKQHDDSPPPSEIRVTSFKKAFKTAASPPADDDDDKQQSNKSESDEEEEEDEEAALQNYLKRRESRKLLGSSSEATTAITPINNNVKSNIDTSCSSASATKVSKIFFCN